MSRKPTKRRAVDPGDERSHRDADAGVFALAPRPPRVAPVPIAPSLSAPEVVEMGARWLDAQLAGWAALVDDPDAVDVRDETLSPLSVPFGGGYWGWIEGVRKLCSSRQVVDTQGRPGWKADDPGALVRFGFAAGEVPAQSPYRHRYVELNAAWKWAIMARREGV